jgi:hypothetical protein
MKSFVLGCQEVEDVISFSLVQYLSSAGQEFSFAKRGEYCTLPDVVELVLGSNERQAIVGLFLTREISRHRL